MAVAVSPDPTAAPTDEPPILVDLRKLAAAAVAGLAAGFLVNGIGSRLMMLLLARMNPEATGRLSDDGFVMGQFTLDNTVGLVAIGTLIGLFGGVVCLGLRSLRIGPDWFQTASMTVGPAIVVGAMLVHTDGVDFRILDPPLLAIGLFVLLPGLFALAVLRLTDHLTREDGWFMTGGRRRMLLAWPLLIPGPWLLLAVVGLIGRQLWLHTQDVPERLLPHLKNLARVALTVLFGMAVIGLAQDIIALT